MLVVEVEREEERKVVLMHGRYGMVTHLLLDCWGARRTDDLMRGWQLPFALVTGLVS